MRTGKVRAHILAFGIGASSGLALGQSANPVDYAPTELGIAPYIIVHDARKMPTPNIATCIGGVGTAMLVRDRAEQGEMDWVLLEGKALLYYQLFSEPTSVVTTPGQFITTRLDGTRTTAADFDRAELNAALEFAYRITVNSKQPIIHAPFINGMTVDAATRVCADMGCTLSVPSGTPGDKIVENQNPPGGSFLAKPASGGTNTITASIPGTTLAAPAGDTQATAIAVNMADKVAKFSDSISPQFTDNISPSGGVSGRADIYYKMVFTGASRLRIEAQRQQKQRVLVAAYTESGGVLSPLSSVSDVRVESLDTKIPAAGNVYIVMEMVDFQYGRLALSARWD